MEKHIFRQKEVDIITRQKQQHCLHTHTHTHLAYRQSPTPHSSRHEGLRSVLHTSPVMHICTDTSSLRGIQSSCDMNPWWHQSGLRMDRESWLEGLTSCCVSLTHTHYRVYVYIYAMTHQHIHTDTLIPLTTCFRLSRNTECNHSSKGLNVLHPLCVCVCVCVCLCVCSYKFFIVYYPPPSMVQGLKHTQRCALINVSLWIQSTLTHVFCMMI